MKRCVIFLLILGILVPRAGAAAPRPLNAAEEAAAARFCAELAPGAPFVIHIAIASVLLNRLADPGYPGELSVLLEQSGFAGAEVTAEDYVQARQAVQYAQLGMDPTSGALKWARRGTSGERGMEVTLAADGWCFGR